MVAEPLLSDKDNVVDNVRLQGIEIGDPLGQPSHFVRHIHQALGFHDHHAAAGELDDEIGEVIREVTVGFGVIQFETAGKMIFGKAHHIGAAVGLIVLSLDDSYPKI